MRKYINNLVSIYIFIITLISCGDSTKPEFYTDARKKTNSIYDYRNYCYAKEGIYYEDRGILSRMIESNDILLIPSLNYDDITNPTPCFKLNYYNYKLDYYPIVENRLANVFVDADIEKIFIVKSENIYNYKPKESQEYGEWSNATVFLKDDFVDNVLITPLATKFLSQKSKENGCLVFVRRSSKEDKFRNCIFYGDAYMEYIVNFYPKLIRKYTNF